MVPLSSIVGRATVVVWPLNNINFLSTGSELSKVAINNSK
jgi:hypothetical protein